MPATVGDGLVGKEVEHDRIDQVGFLLGEEVRRSGYDGELGVWQGVVHFHSVGQGHKASSENITRDL